MECIDQNISEIAQMLLNIKNTNSKKKNSNERIFEGEYFANGMPKSGIITIHLQDNKIFCAVIIDGKMYENTITFADCNWIANIQTDQIVLVKDGIFCGIYLNNQMEYGRIIYNNGQSFQGTFLRGKPHNGLLCDEKLNLKRFIY